MVHVAAGVAGLVDLLEAGADVAGVGGVHGEELVVPGLDAGSVALAETDCFNAEPEFASFWEVAILFHGPVIEPLPET